MSSAREEAESAMSVRSSVVRLRFMRWIPFARRASRNDRMQGVICVDRDDASAGGGTIVEGRFVIGAR